MGKVLIKCDTCGKEFFKYSSKIGKNNFCCRDCYNKFHSKNVKKYTCEICGKIFTGAKANANRFCSRDCYNKFHNIVNKERECPICHKIFIARTSENKYCSQKCHLKNLHSTYKGKEHWNWQGGITEENEKLRKSPEYKKWRVLVYKRDHYQCQICGSKKEINAHHLFGWKEYPDKRFDVNNGITLCKECHIKVHQKYGWTSNIKMTPDFLKKPGQK